MNTAKTIKAINLLQDLFDTKSFDAIHFASDLSAYPDEFAEVFFEVAINFIRETADRHPRDIHTPMMRVYRDIAVKLAKSM